MKWGSKASLFLINVSILITNIATDLSGIFNFKEVEEHEMG